MCLADLDPCTLWREVPRTAAKEHRCASCRARIRKGERHTEHNSLLDGNWCHERVCATCQLVRVDFGGAHGLMPQPGYLAESLQGCIEGAEQEPSSKPWRDALDAILWRRRAAERECL